MSEIFNYNFDGYNFLLILRKTKNNDNKYALKGKWKLGNIYLATQHIENFVFPNLCAYL